MKDLTVSEIVCFVDNWLIVEVTQSWKLTINKFSILSALAGSHHSFGYNFYDWPIINKVKA